MVFFLTPFSSKFHGKGHVGELLRSGVWNQILEKPELNLVLLTEVPLLSFNK